MKMPTQLKRDSLKRIGISGPISTKLLQEYIYDFNPSMPKGLGGIPVNHIIRELINRGYLVTVFSLSPDVAPGKIEVIKGKNLTIYFGHFRRKARYKKLDFFKKEINAIAKGISMAERPDVIHAHWQYEYASAPVDSGIKSVLTCHDAPIQVLKIHKDVYRFIRLLIAIRNLRKYKHITAQSPYAVSENRRFTKSEIDLVTNFEPQWIFDLYKPKSIDNGIKIAMINEGFSKRKNVGIGILAFNRFLKSFPNAELHLYGDEHGPNETAFHFAQQNDALQNIFFHGPMPFDNLMVEFSKYHLLLHTSKEESCPNVISEAFAMGIPVIGGDKSGGVPWMLKDGGGMVTNIHSVEEVTKSLIEAFSGDRYSLLANQARKIGLEKFHPDKIIELYLDAYERAVKDE